MNSASGTDDGFDLPRWQTQSAVAQHEHNYLAASPAAQYSSLYNTVQPPPPPQAQNRLPPLNMQGVSTIGSQPLPSAPARQQTRVPTDTHHQSTQPTSHMNLGRSMSMGTANGRSRIPVDDLEGAYNADPESVNQRSMHQIPTSQHGSQPPVNPSYYAGAIPYSSPSSGQYASNSAETYHEGHFDGQQSPRRAPAHQQQRSQSQQQQHSTSTSTTPRKGVGNVDSYGQSPSIYHTSAVYGSSYTDTPVQYQASSKPSTPYMNSLQTQQSTTSPYSPSYTSTLDTQSTPVSQSRSRHAHALSQTQMAQHLTPQQQYQTSAVLATASNPSSPMAYQTIPQSNYFPPGIKDEPMSDMLPPPVQSARSDSQRDTRGYDVYNTVASSRKPTPMDVSLPRRPPGFRRLRDSRDLRPILNPQPAGRRADPARPGSFLSPLLCLTTQLSSTYSICNPQFRYESSHNPRRVLTKPSKPAHNDGFDNEDYDYILYVNDWLGSDDGNKYLILDVLGQGTFGQVVKCQNMKTHDVVAVKVVKNKPAYFNQSMMEVTILDMLNNQHDPNDEHHILRMLDSFVHKNHLCLVFELLSQNLYELIKQNQFQGLSTQLVKVFTAQLLDAMCVLKDARLIHCDLKPENILLKSLSSPGIKVIDFGSTCHERQTVYTYIQSRFYRSPEVLLGLQYNSAIDMWSLGCIAVELFLGLPLFPGTSEYNQVTRIVEMLGLPPAHMMEHGKQTSQFFECFTDPYGQKQYKLKSIEQYSREHNTQEQPGKQYFKANTLPEIINIAPMPASRHSSTSRPASTEIEREANNRAAFIDFCLGLLNLNPMERWTPQQARRHPFITGEKYLKRWEPYASVTEIPVPSPAALTPANNDPRRPYGGLVQSQPKGSRAYQDAAAYNQQLNQHQTYTAQQQAAQASSQAFRNPYVAQSATQQPSQPYTARNDKEEFTSQQQQQQQLVQRQQGSYGQVSQGLPPPHSAGVSHQYAGQPTSQNVAVPSNPNPPSSSYYPNARARASTINQMDAVPPALARLTQMNKDLSGVGRNTLTPIINREDAIREWERRQTGKTQPAQSYPQLEYLQQQAELAGPGGWQNATTTSRYGPPPTNAMQYQTPVHLLMDNQDRRRDRIRTDVAQEYATMPAPPQTSYAGGDTNLSSMYAPMQPNQYGSAATASQQPSLYGPAVVGAGQSPATSAYMQKSSSLNQSTSSRDTRRNSGMGVDSWRGS